MQERTLWRKLLAGGAVAALSVITLAGCSSGGGNEGDRDVPDSAESPGDISGEIFYAMWGEAQRAGVEKNIEKFTQIHPDIKVTVNATPFGQYWTKLQTQAESGTMPDVFWMNGVNLTMYATEGMLEPINTLVDSGRIDTSKYPEAMNELYTVSGVQYGVPKDYGTVAVFYNAQIFDDARVSHPEPGWTWEDFDRIAKELGEGITDPSIYPVTADLSGQTSYYNTILQAGGTLFGPDSDVSGFDAPEGIKGLEFWADLVTAGLAPTPSELSDTNSETRFASGKAAMFWAGSHSIDRAVESDLKEQFRVVELPRDKEQATIIHGLANVVAAESRNMEAAQAFQEFLGSEEAQRTEGQMNNVIPAYEGTQDEYVKIMPEWGLQVFVDAAQYARPYPIAYSGQAIDAVETKLLPAAFDGSKPVREVAEELAAQVNTLLARK